MRHFFNSALQQRPALEEASSGQTEREIEHTLYGKICDPQQLQDVPWEDHEQWEIRLPKNSETGCEGVMRVRKTTAQDGKVQHVLTCKTKDTAGSDGPGRDETSIETSADMHEQFKQLADRGMLKRRYFFPIQGKDKPWEIDVFPKADGSWHEHCKIDLEVPDLEAPLPPMPVTLSDMITAPYGKRSADEEKVVRGLYDNVFRMKREDIDQVNAARASKKEPQ